MDSNMVTGFGILYSICSLNNFNAEKSAVSHFKKYTTSSFFNRITFPLAIRRRTFQSINLQNFKLKFQTVAGKTAKNFRGLLFSAVPCK